MFHYVEKNFPYYHFDKDLFEKKLIEIIKNNKIISLKDLDNAISNNKIPDNNYVMLTFDDGTKDHYCYVSKILNKYGCSGLFFITSSIFDKKVLNIQILHKLLSLNKFDEMYDILLSELNKINYPIDNINIKSTFDDKKVAVFKQLLQYKLPIEIRDKILKILIDKYNISSDCNDYYINIEQLKEMKQNGMYIGLHTRSHPNLALLNYEEQLEEIYSNLLVLKNNDLVDDKLLSLAYPYGCYNSDTIKILKKLNIKYAFKVSTDNSENLFEINRIDCNVLKR